ncbi:MAG: SDR family oxidoreductase [Gallionella sp.]
MEAKVFITGGSGLLALNWALAIRDAQAVTLGLHERQVFLPGVQTRPADLESVDSLARVLDEAQIGMVIHTAGFTNVDECEAKPDLARHINVDLAANVAKACAKLNLPLVHISTDHLFPGTEAMVTEDTSIAPVNVYGRTKAEAELQVMAAHPQALVMRTNFYGWGPSYRHSFSDVVIQALRSDKELTLFKDVFYTPILIEAAANAAHDLVKLKADGVYHVVGDERISKYEFGLRIAEQFSFNTNLIKPGFLADQPDLIRRPKDMSLSNQKACGLLGRKLGNVAEHIARLHRQEQNGFAQEIRIL